MIEWKSFLENTLLSEISLKRFNEQYPQFDTSSFTSQMKGNTDYLDIISNSISAGQNHGPDDYIQQFEFYKNSIEPNRNSQDFLTIQIPGDEPISLEDKVNQGSCTATYDDIQQFQQARLYVLGKGSKSKLNDAYQSVIDEANEEDFEKVAENSWWVVFYPKTLKGSIALARSYWDGNKVTYDTTLNPSNGSGQNIGEMKWCTSISGFGNMFLNYHRKLNLHMYYCINKRAVDISNPNRKLCISFSKYNNKVTFKEGHASVDGDNDAISEIETKKILGNLFNALKKDAAQEKRLEVDMESYYSSISLEQYIVMRRANEETIEDFTNELKEILNYSKDKDRIIEHAFNDAEVSIRECVASSINTPAEVLQNLSLDSEKSVRECVASNLNTTPEILMFLYEKGEETVNLRISQRNLMKVDPSGNLAKTLAKDENSNIRANVAADLSFKDIDSIKKLAKDIDPKVRYKIARRKNLLEIDPSGDLIRILAKDESSGVRAQIVRYQKIIDIDSGFSLIKKLAKDSDPIVRQAISFRRDLPELDPSGDLIKMLAKDENVRVRYNIAIRNDLLDLDPSGNLVRMFANDSDELVSRAVKNTFDPRIKKILEESLIKDYIRFLLIN